MRSGNIVVSNYQKKIKISRKWVSQVAATILGKMKAAGELSIVLADNKYIRRLNRIYRHKDHATDVLSFPQKRGRFYFSSIIPCLLGDVVISVERAKSQAKEYGYSFKDEMAMLIEHGILHLLGLTHKEMKKWKRK